MVVVVVVVKCKAIPLQPWTGPEAFRSLRLSDFSSGSSSSSDDSSCGSGGSGVSSGSRSSSRIIKKKKDKAIPVQAWTSPEVLRTLRLLHFMTIGT